MGIRLVVAVTDRDWFDHLHSLPGLNEVNFWAPSATPFRALMPGELFLFKLHAPDNFVVGGGVFAYANILPCSLAWEAFGEANGAASLRRCGLASCVTGVPRRTTGVIFRSAVGYSHSHSFSTERVGLMSHAAGLAISSPSRRIQPTIPTANIFGI